MNAAEESWLIEAFADYTAALVLWQLRREDRGNYDFNEVVKEWVQEASDLRPGAGLYFIDRLALNNDTDRSDYVRLRYAKIPLVLHWDTTRDLVETLNQLTGGDWQPGSSATSTGRRSRRCSNRVSRSHRAAISDIQASAPVSGVATSPSSVPVMRARIFET